MISHIPQEDILINWPTISASFEKFWKVGVNYETLPNLKRRLLAEDCHLWMWSNGEGMRLLFVTEDRQTAKARILTVTHTSGDNSSGSRYTRKDFRDLMSQCFSEIEDLALTLYYDAVCWHTRPAHVKLAEGYKKMSQPIIKQLTKLSEE